MPPGGLRPDGRHPSTKAGAAPHWPCGQLDIFHLEDLPAVGDLVLGPQRLDQLNLLAEAAHALCHRNLEIAVVMCAAKPDGQDRPSAADEIERRPLISHQQRVMDRQHDHRRTDADPFGNRRRKGQRHDRIEARAFIDGILGHPEIPEAQFLCAARHGSYCGQR